MLRVYYENQADRFWIEEDFCYLVEPDTDLKEKLEQLRPRDLEPELYNGYFKVKNEALERLGVENESKRDSGARN